MRVRSPEDIESTTFKAGLSREIVACIKIHPLGEVCIRSLGSIAVFHHLVDFLGALQGPH